MRPPWAARIFSRALGVELAGGDGDDGPVPLVADELQLAAYVRLDLLLGAGGLLHGGFDVGRPPREVDRAEFLDDGGPRAEVLVHGGAGEPGALGQGGEGQGVGAALGQQGACGVQQGGALHGAVLGH